MKAKILTDDDSLLTMFRLGGIEGVKVDDPGRASFEFINASSEENLALIILTQKIKDWLKTDLAVFEEENTTPLIVVIDG